MEKRWIWVGLFGTWLSFSGANWDFWWHSHKKPETFFTYPHLMLYTGVFISGVAMIGLLLTLMKQQGERRPYYLKYAPQIGLAGAGSFIQMFAGIADGTYHTIFGFDVTLWSPPHLLAIFGNIVYNVGLANLFLHLMKGRGRKFGYLAASGAALGSLMFSMTEYDHVGDFALDSRWGPYAMYYAMFISLVGSLVFSSVVRQTNRSYAGVVAGIAFVQKLLVYAAWMFTSLRLYFPILIFVGPVFYDLTYLWVRKRNDLVATYVAAGVYSLITILVVLLQAPSTSDVSDVFFGTLGILLLNLLATYFGNRIGQYGLREENLPNEADAHRSDLFIARSL